MVKSAIAEINNIIKDEKDRILVTDMALSRFQDYSEGYPHFLQQLGYSTIQKLISTIIDEKLVEDAMFSKDGALELIGKRYYTDLYYNRINSDDYRQILSIMADKWDSWVTKEEIRQNFKGKTGNLDNGIKALRDRNIILSNPKKRGEYRLQWLSFAFWIKTHKIKR